MPTNQLEFDAVWDFVASPAGVVRTSYPEQFSDLAMLVGNPIAGTSADPRAVRSVNVVPGTNPMYVPTLDYPTTIHAPTGLDGQVRKGTAKLWTRTDEAHPNSLTIALDFVLPAATVTKLRPAATRPPDTPYSTSGKRYMQVMAMGRDTRTRKGNSRAGARIALELSAHSTNPSWDSVKLLVEPCAFGNTQTTTVGWPHAASINITDRLLAVPAGQSVRIVLLASALGTDGVTPPPVEGGSHLYRPTDASYGTISAMNTGTSPALVNCGFLGMYLESGALLWDQVWAGAYYVTAGAGGVTVDPIQTVDSPPAPIVLGTGTLSYSTTAFDEALASPNPHVEFPDPPEFWINRLAVAHTFIDSYVMASYAPLTSAEIADTFALTTVPPDAALGPPITSYLAQGVLNTCSGALKIGQPTVVGEMFSNLELAVSMALEPMLTGGELLVDDDMSVAIRLPAMATGGALSWFYGSVSLPLSVGASLANTLAGAVELPAPTIGATMETTPSLRAGLRMPAIGMGAELVSGMLLQGHVRSARLATYGELAATIELQGGIVLSLRTAGELASQRTKRTLVFFPEQKGFTHYVGYDFDRYFAAGGVTYGVKLGRVYALGGDTDEGAPIASSMLSAANVGRGELKRRLNMTYVRGTVDGTVKMKAVGDQLVMQGSELPAVDGQQVRALFGRGHTAVRWNIGFDTSRAGWKITAVLPEYGTVSKRRS